MMGEDRHARRACARPRSPEGGRPPARSLRRRVRRAPERSRCGPTLASSPFRVEREQPLLVRAVPIAGDVPGYRRSTAVRDVLGGATVAVLSIPSAMAYAEVARGTARQRAVHAAPADAGLRHPRLVPPARGRCRGRCRRAGGRRGAAARAGRLEPRRGARVAADAAGRRLLPGGAAGAPRLPRRLLLAPGADRVPARRGDRDRAGAARQAARHLHELAGAADEARPGAAPPRRGQRRDRGRRSRGAHGAARHPLPSCPGFPGRSWWWWPRSRSPGRSTWRRTASRWSERCRRAAAAVAATRLARRDHPALAGGGGDLRGDVRRRDPDRALLRRAARRPRARQARSWWR